MRQSRCKPIRHLIGAPTSAEIQDHFAYVRGYTRDNATWCCRLRVKSVEDSKALDKARYLRCAYRRQKASEVPRRQEAHRVTEALSKRLRIAALRKAERQARAAANRGKYRLVPAWKPSEEAAFHEAMNQSPVLGL